MYRQLKLNSKWENVVNGSWYEIVGFSDDTDTLDRNVIYKRIRNPFRKDEEISDKWLHRLYASWTEDIEHEGKKVKRYKEVK